MRVFPTALFLALIAIAAPAHAASLQAFTAVIGGSNTACSGAGGPDPAITSFFPVVGDFGLLTDPGGDSIGGCGLSGSIGNLTSATGPLSSATTLATTAYTSYPANSISGYSSATAAYGSVSIFTSTTLNGVEGFNGQGDSAAFAIASDTLNVACVPSCTTGFMAFDFTFSGSITIAPADTGGGTMEVDVEAGGNTGETLFYGNVEGSSVSAAGIASVGGTLHPGQAISGCVIASGTFTCTGATLQTYMMPVTFTPGVALSFGVVGETSPGVNQTITVDPPDLTLSGIQVYDAGGNLLSDFTIGSGSGSSYGADGFESGPGSATPEPATFLPMAAGLTFLAIKNRRFLYRRA